MATLQVRNGSYRVLFCHGGRRLSFTVGRVDAREAELVAAGVERLLLRVEQGLLRIPAGVDVVEFVRHDGRVPERPEALAIPARPLTLGELRDRYLATHGNGALEPSTLLTARIHLDHVIATLGERLIAEKLTPADLQRHIDRRAKVKGRKGRRISPTTIRKEVSGLRAAFRWAVDAGLCPGAFPGRGLVYPKADEKPPFQTRAEIERRIAAGGLAAAEIDELWDSLFLTLPEVEALLDHVRTHAAHDWIHPMFVAAAHTGARRSELLRIQTGDLDLAGGTLLLREKKKARGRRTTRRVPLSPLLSDVLAEWLGVHPGGPHLFCQSGRVRRSKTRREHPTAITRDEAHDHFKRTLAGGTWSVLRGWHVLRHSFASNCAAQGIDQRLIDDWLGHTTEEMRRRYRHLIPSREQQAIRSVFGGASVESPSAS